MNYECDKCGACCAGHLIVEAYELDVLREPRLVSADPHYAGRTVQQALEELQDEMKIVLLTGQGSCPFLTADNTCSIYLTRPNACVAMQAGDEQCQQARAAEGLPPLGRLCQPHAVATHRSPVCG